LSEDVHTILQAARTGRAHLSGRAMLALVIRLARSIESSSGALRARLDPTGGAEAPAHARKPPR
jgi:hypothetical protein